VTKATAKSEQLRHSHTHGQAKNTDTDTDTHKVTAKKWSVGQKLNEM